MDQITLFLCNIHIRWRPYLAHFRGILEPPVRANYPRWIVFFQLGKLFHAQKCLSTNFRAKTKKFLRATFFRKNIFFQSFCDFFFENSGAHQCAQKSLTPKNTPIVAPSLKFFGRVLAIFRRAWKSHKNLKNFATNFERVLSIFGLPKLGLLFPRGTFGNQTAPNCDF